MPEEERLSLVSEVEDEFTEPLERLEQSLESVDNQIRDTGRGRDHVRIDVEVGAADAISEIHALDSAIESLDDDLRMDVEGDVDENQLFQGSPNLTDEEATGVADMFNPKAAFRQTPGMEASGGGEAIADAGEEQRTFAINNWDEWADELGPYLDKSALANRGGEVTRLDMALEDGLDDVVDMDELVRRSRDPDSNITGRTISNLTTGGVSEAMDALDLINDEDDSLTMLGASPDASKQFRRSWKSLADMRFTMGEFHQMIASVIPILGVFVGALPAAIVGVGALATAALGAAAALGGIAGLGALGMMMTKGGGLSTDSLMQRLREVGDSYLDAFAPLARSMAPVMESAIASVERMSGPLADASAGLLAFRDEFKGVTAFITGALPSFTNELLAFSHAAAPLVADVVGAISGVDFFGFFAQELATAWPALVMMGQAITQILPAIVHLSQGFLVVAAVLTGVIGMVSMLANQFPLLTTVIGGLIGVLIAIVSLTTLWTIATETLMASSLGLAKTLIMTTIPSLKAMALNLWMDAVAAWGLYGALVAVITVLSLGIGVVAAMSSKFGKLGSNISNARKELDKFANSKNAMNGDIPVGGSSATGGAANPYIDNSTTVINAGDRDSAARQQYSSSYEKHQYRDSVFGN